MKFFGWMKSKIHGKDNTIKPEPESSPSHHLYKEETTGCSSTLLSIGTFGNNIEDSDSANSHEIAADHLENTVEKEFEKELRSLLNEHASTSSGESEHFDLPMEKMLENFQLHEEVGLPQNANSTGKDIPSCSSRKGSIYKKSISFLLRKAFVCGGGFAPPPIFRDPFLDTNLDRSRMEKILKTAAEEEASSKAEILGEKSDHKRGRTRRGQ